MKVRESTIAASLLLDLARYLEKSGIPASDFWRGIVADPSSLESPNARVPGSIAERVWEQAVRLSGDQDLGLHTAENFNPGALNLLGYVILSCRSASEVLGRLAQYAALLNDGLRVRISKDGERTVCQFEIAANLDNYLMRSPRHALETMACGTLVTLRRLTSTDLQPLRVAFRHPAPPDTREHERIFGQVAFQQPEHAMEFRTSDLEGTLLSSNPMLLEMFDAQARQLLGQMEQRGPVSRRVLDFLARRITVAVPGLDEVASELGMSERTLQRELRLEKTSFRQLIEDIRKEIAMQHLAQPGASASEAAFLLGFSEPSAFTRAFRRWTGSAPTEFQSA
jgi:AraC-like DNA-binding protein